MRKCSVGRTRKRSAGSKRVAAIAGTATPRATTNVVQAFRPGTTTARLKVRTTPPSWARLTPLRLSRPGVRVLGFTRGAREDDAEDECGHAKETGADEEESVRVEQRASRGQPL